MNAKEQLKSFINFLIRSIPGIYKVIDVKKKFGHNKKNIRALRDKYYGKRCFIIGNGPSLNKIDLSLLKDEYTFGVNSIFLKTDENGFSPTFYIVEDRHVMNDNKERINKYNANIKFFPSIYKKFIKNRKGTIFFKMDSGYYNKTSPFFCIPRFSPDASDVIYCGQSVTMINLQLAYYLGFTKIYLIGMDHSYSIPRDAIVNGEQIESTSSDPNHFHPDYFGKGKKWHDPHLDRVERTYMYYRIVFEAKNREIINATTGGQLEIFKRMDFNSLFL